MRLLYFYKLVYGIQIILNFAVVLKYPLEYQNEQTREKNSGTRDVQDVWNFIGRKMARGDWHPLR